MDDPGRMAVDHWANFGMKHNMQDHPALKLMDMMRERDAAIGERVMALVEKKTSFAERESAFLQRDVAIADRNAAWMERDAAVMALSMVRAGKDNREVAAELMQMVNIAALPLFARETNLQSLSKIDQESDHQIKESRGKTSPKRWNFSGMPNHYKPESVSPSKKKRKRRVHQGAAALSDKYQNGEGMPNNVDALVHFSVSGVHPIPHCSCTGANQHCYRWGKGGWQSACCTNFLSMYPLPMNPVKRSSRVPGRKMSGGAFKKLLERLAGDGVDISVSIDLKNYWAKHGTNMYATVK